MADEDDAWGDAGYGDEEEGEEEYEVEEVADDAPMRISGRVFLGSIDAARNSAALQCANVGVTLALLGAEDERVADDGDARVKRVLVEIEDSLEESLFGRLPALLAKLQEALDEAERRGCNVLVHCMAGRSRSPSLVAAWLVTKHGYSLQGAIGHIQMIRPWIEINARFQTDLEVFEGIVRFRPLGEKDAIEDRDRMSSLLPFRASLPRLDFGASLVTDILTHRKLVTMRLASDMENDANSDLARIFQHSTVVATSATSQATTKRDVFAFLRIDRVDASVPLNSVDATTLKKTGFTSTGDVLSVLNTFYPDVTMETPLLLVHFTCLGNATATAYKM